MQSLVNVYGPDMLRYKGLLYVQGSELRVVFQGVHQIFSADALGRWGERKPMNRIVVIGRNLPQDAILKGLDSCLA